ncbi:unnamed protein product [Gongylonema pulchrum]|uniref:WD-3 domain-containing protein n=1 Tax=Gongylonema pulchrum TaxID=637853 RepID=A0A183EGC2_9BILA|nr:unnamed protein product [Gongylonema pulchrum]
MEVPVEPWDDFLAKCEVGKKQSKTVSESEWEWFDQLCELADEECCCSELDQSLQQVTLTVRLDASTYTLVLSRSADFPRSSPEMSSSLGASFEYEWHSGDTISSLYRQFIEICLRIDFAVMACKEVSFPFVFKEWQIDKTDPTSISITLTCNEGNAENEGFTLNLSVDWSEPNLFPRSITSPTPECLQHLRFDEWDSSLPFAENLRRIFLLNHDENTLCTCLVGREENGKRRKRRRWCRQAMMQ